MRGRRDNVTYDIPVQWEQCLIVGDVHGCMREFASLLAATGQWMCVGPSLIPLPQGSRTKNPCTIILVGDYIDKGPEVAYVIDFLFENKDKILLVRGNHENFVYKYLKGILPKDDTNKMLIANWFETVYLLEQHDILREKFFKLFENSFDFIETPKFVVTHAPCAEEYLCGTNPKAIQKQRNFVYPKGRDYPSRLRHKQAITQTFAELFADSDANKRLHFFGHVVTEDVVFYNNKRGIDTGCYCGGKLTGVLVSSGRQPEQVIQIESQQPRHEETFVMPFKSPSVADYLTHYFSYERFRNLSFGRVQ